MNIGSLLPQQEVVVTLEYITQLKLASMSSHLLPSDSADECVQFLLPAGMLGGNNVHFNRYLND